MPPAYRGPHSGLGHPENWAVAGNLGMIEATQLRPAPRPGIRILLQSCRTMAEHQHGGAYGLRNFLLRGIEDLVRRQRAPHENLRRLCSAASKRATRRCPMSPGKDAAACPQYTDNPCKQFAYTQLFEHTDIFHMLGEKPAACPGRADEAMEEARARVPVTIGHGPVRTVTDGCQPP